MPACSGTGVHVVVTATAPGLSALRTADLGVLRRLELVRCVGVLRRLELVGGEG